MDMITISAKTLDEAITKALLELQTTSEHLHYEIVQKETSGVFGIFGAKPCIIRARVMTEEEEKALKKAAAEKEKVEKAAKEAEKKLNESETVKNTEDHEKHIKAEKPEKIVLTPVDKPEEVKITKPEKTQFNEDKKIPEKKNYERKKQERKGDGRRERPIYKGYDSRFDREEPGKAIREEKLKQPVKGDPKKIQGAAKDFLVNVFGAMGMDVSIETLLNLEEGDLQVMLSGDDMGILIGKRGQTLDSLQYLVSLVVNKETEGYLRVKLDTENYRERRKETLETLARNISYKVKRTKHPVSLEPMNPYERRIIHSTLQNDRYVITRSEGEDPYRHVVISLRNERYGGGRRDRYGSRRDKDHEKVYGKRIEKQMVSVEDVPDGAGALGEKEETGMTE